ncbi:DEAD/DEAH box helicase [Aquimarina hainanensis]|uniref:DEAD/DEAH box helicase n=1 Tax=Aquimarina hainanensis TaxID=1578017 RepID=A0ABW5NCD9_9FLAO
MSISFSSLGIQESLQKGLSALRISQPTAIQEKAIPVVLEKTNDIVGLAKTGTGKTLAFGLPLLQLINTGKSEIQAIILVPTRELGQQIYTELKALESCVPDVSLAVICGGVPIKPQIELLKETTHIVIATPGRLLDLQKRKAIDITTTAYFVLDEADEMISAQKKGVDQIIEILPKKRRTILFTATMSGAIKNLVHNYMAKDVVEIAVSMETIGHQGIDHQYVVVDPIEKLEVLMHFLTSRYGERGIIFCKTKAAVNKLAKKLAIHRFSSGALHGSLSQPIRDRIMGQFREGHIDILVATDLAARGIDVKEISYVVHYHLPDYYETYVHRSGRTARAGRKGTSLTVLLKEEKEEIPDFEEELGITFNEIQKADAQGIEENNVFLWAKKIFKTKPNRELSSEFKEKVHTVFHHLTKEELVEKLIAYTFDEEKVSSK